MEQWWDLKLDSRLIDKMEVYAKLAHGYEIQPKSTANWIIMKNDLGDKIKIGKKKGKQGEDLFTNVYNESIKGSIIDLAAYHLSNGEISRKILEPHFKAYLNEPISVQKEKVIKESQNFIRNKEAKKHFAQTNTNYKPIEDYDFLVQHRHLSYETLQSKLFKDRIFNSYFTYNNSGKPNTIVNTAFPTYKAKKIDGLEIRNKPRGLYVQKLIQKIETTVSDTIAEKKTLLDFLESKRKYKYVNKLAETPTLVPEPIRALFLEAFHKHKENVNILHQLKPGTTQGTFISNADHLPEVKHVFIGESAIDVMSHHEVLESSNKADVYTNRAYLSTGGNIYDEKIKVLLHNIKTLPINEKTSFYSITDNDAAGIKYDFLISTALINALERPLEVNSKENLNTHYETITFSENNINDDEIAQIKECILKYNNEIKKDTNKILKIETNDVNLKVSENIIFKCRNEYQDQKIHLQFPKGFDFTKPVYQNILQILKCQKYYQKHKPAYGLKDWNDVLKHLKKEIAATNNISHYQHLSLNSLKKNSTNNLKFHTYENKPKPSHYPKI